MTRIIRLVFGLLVLSVSTLSVANAQSLFGQPDVLPLHASPDVRVKPVEVVTEEKVGVNTEVFDGQLRKSDFVKPDCANLAHAKIYYPDSRQSMNLFYSKLRNLLNGKNEKINILHIGGSHVQAGTISGAARDALVNMHEGMNGDRGIMFPFQAIGTNAPKTYSFTHTGRWSKGTIMDHSLNYHTGLVGAAAVTSDPSASLRLDVKDSKWSFDELMVVGSSIEGAVPMIKLNGEVIKPYDTDRNGYRFRLPRPITECNIFFEGLGHGAKFEFRGVISNSNRSGITYYEAGINGASVPSWQSSELFEQELKLLPPDLVVFAIGINDANVKNGRFSRDAFINRYEELIAKVKRVNPDCSFIFITNNDCFIGGTRRVNPNTIEAEQGFIELARRHKCGVFNVFRIMGGPGSSNTWVSKGLLQKDHIHFTGEGYKLLGTLLGNAIIDDFVNNGNI